MTERESLLRLQDLSVAIEGHSIVKNLDLHVNKGEAVGLIGRNGAGKTTTFRGIMGHATVTAGSIQFKQQELTELSPDKIAKLGIGYQSEGRDLFTGMTVDENIRLPIWASKGDTKSEEEIVSEVYDIFPELIDFKQHNVENLSGGQAKMAAIGRAVALQPDLLILDEPLEGLAPIIVQNIKEIVANINKRGIAVLLAESNLAHATELVDRVYIIERGEIFEKGAADELIKQPKIQNLLQG